MKVRYVFTALWMLAVTTALGAQDAFTAPVTASGDLLLISGRILDTAGGPLPAASVRIWQTDAAGYYDHPAAPNTTRRDPGFQFYGTAAADGNGRYTFRTVLPATYGGRPRHIHVKVFSGSGEVLTTQFYFSADGETAGVGGSTRNLRLELVPMEPAGGRNRFSATFDLVIGPAGGRIRPTDAQGEGPYYPVTDVAAFDNDLASTRP